MAMYRCGSGGSSATPITPSNSSPVALTANTPVNPTTNGYAIASYQSKTPSTSGVSFNSGMVKMSSSGYAYSGRAELKSTTLWSNSSSTTSYSGGDVTLSQDIDNFAYIGIRFKATTASASDSGEIIVSSANLKKASSSGESNVRVTLCANDSTSTIHVRAVSYVSDTKLNFGQGRRVNASGTSNTVAIPTSIVGYNISA